MTQHIIHMENGRLADDTPFPQVEQMVNAAVATGNVVVHLHGGLVSERRGRTIAEQLTPAYQEAGAYPIFLVWEAGLIETIKNNFGRLVAEQLFRVVLKRVLRIARRKFVQDQGGRSAGTVPDLDVTASEAALDDALSKDDPALMPPEPTPDAGLTPLSDVEAIALEAELQADPEVQMVVQAVSNGLRDPAEIEADEAARSTGPVVASSETLMDPAAVDRLVDRPDPSARGLFSTARIIKAIVLVSAQVIQRYLSGRDHGFHATVVEEILREFYVANIGGAIWGQMKGDTKDSFGAGHAEFGGTALIKVLSDRIQEGAQPRVTLVGHSTGAVYIAHLLAAADPVLPVGFQFDVVLLAPASTFELATSTFIAHRSRIGGMRMFTMTDDNEKADRLVRVLYPHSLLYFVSGVLEAGADTPITGLERHYDSNRYDPSKFPEVDAFRRLIGAIPNGAVWSVATGSGPGLETKATHHGDFDNEPTTLKSVKHIIENGF